MPDDTIKRRPQPHNIDEFLGQARGDLPPATPARKKLKAFNLPLPLIRQIEAEAEFRTGGNSSALAARIFRDYFARQDDIDTCR
jgi:hypothetical protein